jgi:hypothetical protein
MTKEEKAILEKLKHFTDSVLGEATHIEFIVSKKRGLLHFKCQMVDADGNLLFEVPLPEPATVNLFNGDTITVKVEHPVPVKLTL